MQPKEIRTLLSGLEGQGATVKATTKGWQVKCPSGGLLTIHRTPSDHRAVKNLRSIVKRQGMRWPLT